MTSWNEKLHPRNPVGRFVDTETRGSQRPASGFKVSRPTLSQSKIAAYRLRDATDEPSVYARRALEDQEQMGPDAVTVLLAATPDRKREVLGAASLVDRSEEGALVINYIGSRRPGVGRELLRQAQNEARDRGLSLLAEPTQGSASFWGRVGARRDPDGVGTDFVGWSLEDLRGQ